MLASIFMRCNLIFFRIGEPKKTAEQKQGNVMKNTKSMKKVIEKYVEYGWIQLFVEFIMILLSKKQYWE